MSLWNICWILFLIAIYVLVKNLNETQRNQIIEFINKSLPTTPLTPTLKQKTIVPISVPLPPPQFSLGMDVKQWTDMFLFYLKENNINQNKNELLLSKLEPFCLSLIEPFKFSSDLEVSFEQHILLMNKLFQLKRKTQNVCKIIPAKLQESKKTVCINKNSNMRLLIPSFSLDLKKCGL